MGIKVNRLPLNAVEIISENDDSLDLEKCNWDEYKKSFDRGHLVFIPGKQPTVFLCNFSLKGKESASIKNNLIGGADDEGKPKIALGSWSHRVVKLVLKDIKNPDDIPEDQRIVFKKDDLGYAHDDVLTLLEQAGVLTEIFTHYTTASGGIRGNAKN